MSANTMEREPPAATGYRMIDSIKIQNFRCFENAAIQDARRINVIVGPNGTGKTTFLEAVFLAAGYSPGIATRLRAMRGFDGTFQAQQRLVEDALWNDLFRNFDKKKDVQIFLNGSDDQTRSLKISSIRSETSVSLFDPFGIPSRRPIQFQWSGPYGRTDEITPEIKGGNIWFPEFEATPTDTYFFAATQTYPASELASRFSELSKRGGESEFVQLMKDEFHFLRDFSIQLQAGIPMLYVKTDFFPERVPINLISGGINKIALQLSSIPASPRCILLIDEIEGGIYYERMPMIWRSFMHLCRKFDAQVFATTHSRECLSALAEACADYPDDVSLIRTSTDDKTVELEQFWGNNVLIAMKKHNVL